MDMIKMSEFHLVRLKDESGVSGEGIVARGFTLPGGEAVVQWESVERTITIFRNLNAVGLIHGHEGKTRIVMGPPPGVIDVKIEPEEEKPVKKPRRKNAKTK